MKLFWLSLLLMVAGTCQAQANDINITAEQQVEWHQKENKIVAIGDAVATQDNQSIRADKLVGWYAGRQNTTKGKSSITRIEGLGHVVLRSPNADGLGDYLDYDLVKDIAVLKGAPAQIKTDKETITARDSITYYPSEQKAIALGEVMALDKDNNKIYCDRMIAYFTKGSDASSKLALDRVEIYENVRITTKDAVVTSDRGVYYPKTGKVHLFDNIVINQEGNILRGDKAETDLNSGVSRLLSSSSSGRVKGVFKEKKKAPAAQTKNTGTNHE